MRSFEFYIRPVDTVFEVGEIAFESIDVRFEVFDAHQSETDERLVPPRHQRKPALRGSRLVRLPRPLADEFFSSAAQFATEEFVVVHGEAHTGVQPATVPEGRSNGPCHRVRGLPTDARAFTSARVGE